jgi:hypothetical protein
MRNTEKVRRSAAPNLLVQFPLAELTLQLAVDPSKNRRSIPARADGRSQQKPTVDPSKSRQLIPTVPPPPADRHCAVLARVTKSWSAVPPSTRLFLEAAIASPRLRPLPCATTSCPGLCLGATASSHLRRRRLFF